MKKITEYLYECCWEILRIFRLWKDILKWILFSFKMSSWEGYQVSMDLIRSRKSGGRKRSLFQRKPRWGLGDKGEVLAGECMASFVSHCLSLLWDCQYQCPHMSSINFCNFYFIQFSYGLCGPCTSLQIWAPFVSN